MNKINNESYGNQISRLFPNSIIRSVTFQVTDDCTCQCTYCYQTNKGKRFMDIETGKKIVDLLFQMYEENDPLKPINHTTTGLVLDFIGGEPLMNIKLIEEVCDYFIQQCVLKKSKWLYYSRIGLCTNGSLYFNENVQRFIKKFNHLLALTITLDGPKEIHDKCRIYPNGEGNFKDAFAAYKHYEKFYGYQAGTKVTISPENLNQLNTIIDFFVENNVDIINANCVFEAEWNKDQALLFYNQLKILADKLLTMDNVYISFFEEKYFIPMSQDDNQNWCGGAGKMMAFDPEGYAHPCLRYMSSSLNGDQPPIIIGNVNGVYTTKYQKKIKQELDEITRKSQSTNECFYCPIASGCAWCSAWNYQLYGTPNKRCTYICIMHKARALANIYYWNKKYRQENSNKRKKLYLPKHECLKIIDLEEYEMLKTLEEQ